MLLSSTTFPVTTKRLPVFGWLLLLALATPLEDNIAAHGLVIRAGARMKNRVVHDTGTRTHDRVRAQPGLAFKLLVHMEMRRSGRTRP